MISEMSRGGVSPPSRRHKSRGRAAAGRRGRHRMGAARVIRAAHQHGPGRQCRERKPERRGRRVRASRVGRSRGAAAVIKMRERHQPSDRVKSGWRGRVPLLARLADLRASRQRSLLGVPETIALASAALLLVAAVSSYFLMLAPERTRLRERQAERQRLQAILNNATEGLKRGRARSRPGTKSWEPESFEAAHLSSLRGEGSTALIAELNRLIRSNNLRITMASRSHSSTRPRPARRRERKDARRSPQEARGRCRPSSPASAST